MYIIYNFIINGIIFFLKPRRILNLFIFLVILHFFNVFLGEHIVFYAPVFPTVIDEKGHQYKKSSH